MVHLLRVDFMIAPLRLSVLCCFFVLCFAGCEPYPDHEELIEGLTGERVDFGRQRALRLTRFEGTRESLLLQFNQPIQWPEDTSDVPLEFQFHPKISIASVERQGLATVKVHFANELPRVFRYEVSVSGTMRALSGASFMLSLIHI